jgi:hypothetical protein
MLVDPWGFEFPRTHLPKPLLPRVIETRKWARADLVRLAGGKSEEAQQVFGHPVGGCRVIAFRFVLQ